MANVTSKSRPTILLHLSAVAPPITMGFNRIPAGKFLMGSRGHFPQEEPVHEVEITQDFYLGVYPVTQAQFRQWTQSENIDHQNEFEGKDDHPAESMDWQQARQFCDWLMSQENAKTIIPQGYRARLPTEAEWEYACASWHDGAQHPEHTGARRYTEYHTGDGDGALREAGWYGYYADRGNMTAEGTQPVGQFQANQFGLHDMHGNVFEWCLDAWDSDAYRTRASSVCNPLIGDSSGRVFDPFDVQSDDAFRVLRGGSWGGQATGCRAAYRFGYRPGNRFGIYGFRVGLFPVRSHQLDQLDQPAGKAAAARTGGERGGTTR